MVGLIGRISTVLKARISMLLDRADDPTEVLGRRYEQQLEQLRSVKKDITDIVAAQKGLQSRLAQEVAKHEGQARDATSSGEADLARAAVECKHLLQADARSLEQQIAELEGAKEQLSDAEAKLHAWAELFRADSDSADFRNSAAGARAYLSEAAADAGNALADVAFAMQRAVENTERIKARVLAIEKRHHADTVDEATAVGPGPDEVQPPH
jgi:phage shock protein A